MKLGKADRQSKKILALFFGNRATQQMHGFTLNERIFITKMSTKTKSELVK
jgi:hypothetical protein